MTNKEYLNRIRRSNELLQTNFSEIERLRQLSLTLSSPGVTEAVSKSKSPDAAYVKTVEKIVDLECKIRREIDTIVDQISEVSAVINLLDDPNERLLLKLRYVEMLKWEDVAKRMGYTKRYTEKLHKRAIEHIKIPPAPVIGH